MQKTFDDSTLVINQLDHFNWTANPHFWEEGSEEGLLSVTEPSYDLLVKFECGTSNRPALRQNMGFFETIKLKRPDFGVSRDDLIQFVAGATMGVLFLIWSVWTWDMIVLG